MTVPRMFIAASLLFLSAGCFEEINHDGVDGGPCSVSSDCICGQFCQDDGTGRPMCSAPEPTCIDEHGCPGDPCVPVTRSGLSCGYSACQGVDGGS
jgi:hypothetical protein